MKEAHKMRIFFGEDGYASSVMLIYNDFKYLTPSEIKLDVPIDLIEVIHAYVLNQGVQLEYPDDLDCISEYLSSLGFLEMANLIHQALAIQETEDEESV